MSNELESIVRPFQSNDITPSQTYFEPGEIGIQNVILRIGRSGSGKVLTGSYTANESHYMDKYETEKKFPGGRRYHSQFVGKFGQGVIGQPMGQQ